jgi:2,4-dienoyl-CoA reductase-like NADH-dependent reductase (Old Yellow Enzyme family)
MPALFDPIKIKGLELKNRITMSSMCQYQAYRENII